MILAYTKNIINYRGFIIGSIKRELQTRYSNSMFGAVWLIIQPLAMIIVYTVIFSKVMQAKLPGTGNAFSYSIYLCAGIIPWGLFSEMAGRAQNIFIDNANLLKKLSFPRICLPLILSGTSLINFSIIFSLFVVFLLISGNFPGLPFLGVFPLILVQVLFAIGLGLVIGVLNVFFRDIGQAFGILLQFWFWFTPIVYPQSIIPEWAHVYLRLNPLAEIIMGFHNIFVYQQWPEWINLWPTLVITLISLLIGFYLFQKHNSDMIDEL